MTDSWRDDIPIYRQIKDRVIAAILDGGLKEGDPVPSVRAVAVETRVNPLTVSKAYQELQLAGILESRRGLGLFVIEGARGRLAVDERNVFLTDEWPHIAARIKRLGLEPAELLAQIKED